MQNGKGDSFRPVNRERFESNYEEIDWRRESHQQGRKVGNRDVSSERVEREDPPQPKEPE